MSTKEMALILMLTSLMSVGCSMAETPAGSAGGEAMPAPVTTEAPAGPTPIERVDATKQGELKNPYAGRYDDAVLIEQGRKKFLGASCNGCHGGTGGGGMCPPLSNEVWVYGSDDDTLFRLITLGSVELQKRYGLTRKGRENVVGPMPAHGDIVKTEDNMWKIITFIRSIYRGDPAKDPRNNK